MEDSINMPIVEELKQLMEEDFPLLIETYVNDCDARIDALALAISNQDATEVREIAHAFKGSSSNLGAEKLTSICFRLETMGREGELANANDEYINMKSEYLKVREYFKNLL